MALVALQDDLLREADRGRTFQLILLDLSVAFDTIDHSILLGRLSGLGIGGQAFLEDRPQRVQLVEMLPTPWTLSCGVLQVSIISPVLFNIYMRPLEKLIRSLGASCHQSVDHTQLFLSFHPSAVDAVLSLVRCPDTVLQWMKDNRLRLNLDKMEILWDMICHHLVLLKEKRIKILAYKAETEGKSQHLLKETKAEMEKMKEQFREMSSFLNEQEKLLLAHLEGVEKEIVRKRDEHLAILSEELSSLGGLIQAMDQKCQQPPGELLQDVRSILQTEEKTKTFQNPLAFPPELKLKVWDVCDQNIFLAEMMQQFRDALLTGPVLHKANVTLDPKTASPRLALSEDCKSVRHEFRWQDVEDHPERFNFSPFVLGQEGFTAGRHYWEVTVESGGNWAVGVARKSVWRKGHVGLNTKEGIWAAGKWKSCNDVGCSDPPQSFVSLSGKPRRIRVSLKCDVGQVSFYDADTQSHLYTISGASFTGETILPFFGVWGKTFLTLRDSSRPRRKSKLVKNWAHFSQT
uniref:E3 ubiquitin-protein ligase TRIM15-like isoform X2 n=1 Tax=Pogona vitticeps TaxID=103695 RepID=A0ABM5FH09_9SAUR